MQKCSYQDCMGSQTTSRSKTQRKLASNLSSYPWPTGLALASSGLDRQSIALLHLGSQPQTTLRCSLRSGGGVVNHCAIQHCGSSEPTGHGDGCSHLRKPPCSIYVGSCSVSDRESENSRVGAQQTRNFDSALKSPISGYLDISEEEGSAQL